MAVRHKGGSSANGNTAIFDFSQDYVKKVVPERKQCFSSKCRISDIDNDKLSFKNPDQDKPCNLCFRVMIM